MRFLSAALCCVAVLVLLGSVEVAEAGVVPWRNSGPATVVMLSDMHFDPFHDPGKVAQLQAAKIGEWPRILESPVSADQAARFAELQTACHARGVDSSWQLMNGTLAAAHVQEAKPLFVTVTGDLLTHGFDCRLRTLLPHATDDDVASFAKKTVAFVVQSVRRSFPGTAVYFALGNNDSGCSNYHQTSGSEFIRATSKSIASGFDTSLEKTQVLKAFSDRGDYSVMLPGRMRHTRLVVLQNVFESGAYQVCGGGKDAGEAERQIRWLTAQLDAAEKAHQTVWVMAHIPPGVDAYASYHAYIAHPEALCSSKPPVQMLGSDELAETIAKHAEVVRLAIFAHTHMDEIKLLKDEAGHVVPAKLVPSISPVNGNHPAFTVAQVNPRTATLVDYEVYVGVHAEGGPWKQEYRFSQVYHLPDLSAQSMAALADGFARDRTGDEPASLAYQRWFMPGDAGSYAQGLHAIWPGYACAIVEDGGPRFHDCMCPADVPAPGSSGR